MLRYRMLVADELVEGHTFEAAWTELESEFKALDIFHAMRILERHVDGQLVALAGDSERVTITTQVSTWRVEEIEGCELCTDPISQQTGYVSVHEHDEKGRLKSEPYTYPVGAEGFDNDCAEPASSIDHGVRGQQTRE